MQTSRGKMKGYYQNVECPNCGEKRQIHRRQGTPENHTYWCSGCRKDVVPVPKQEVEKK